MSAHAGLWVVSVAVDPVVNGIVVALTGMTVPEGSPERVRAEVVDPHLGLVRFLTGLEGAVADVAGATASGADGEAIDAYIRAMAGFASGDGADYVKGLKDTALQLADAGNEYAYQLEYTNMMIVEQVILFFAELAVIAILEVFNPVQAAFEKLALDTFFRELFTTELTQFLARVAAQTASIVTMNVVLAAALDGFTRWVLATQGKHTAHGNEYRNQSLKFGAIQGAVSSLVPFAMGPIGKGIGKLPFFGPKSVKDIRSIIGESLHGPAPTTKTALPGSGSVLPSGGKAALGGEKALLGGGKTFDRNAMRGLWNDPLNRELLSGNWFGREIGRLTVPMAVHLQNGVVGRGARQSFRDAVGDQFARAFGQRLGWRQAGEAGRVWADTFMAHAGRGSRVLGRELEDTLHWMPSGMGGLRGALSHDLAAALPSPSWMKFARAFPEAGLQAGAMNLSEGFFNLDEQGRFTTSWMTTAGGAGAALGSGIGHIGAVKLGHWIKGRLGFDLPHHKLPLTGPDLTLVNKAGGHGPGGNGGTPPDDSAGRTPTPAPSYRTTPRPGETTLPPTSLLPTTGTKAPAYTPWSPDTHFPRSGQVRLTLPERLITGHAAPGAERATDGRPTPLTPAPRLATESTTRPAPASTERTRLREELHRWQAPTELTLHDTDDTDRARLLLERPAAAFQAIQHLGQLAVQAGIPPTEQRRLLADADQAVARRDWPQTATHLTTFRDHIRTVLDTAPTAPHTTSSSATHLATTTDRHTPTGMPTTAAPEHVPLATAQVAPAPGRQGVPSGPAISGGQAVVTVTESAPLSSETGAATRAGGGPLPTEPQLDSERGTGPRDGRLADHQTADERFTGASGGGWRQFADVDADLTQRGITSRLPEADVDRHGERAGGEPFRAPRRPLSLDEVENAVRRASEAFQDKRSATGGEDSLLESYATQSPHDLTVQDCLTLLHELRNQIFPHGVRTSTTVDDSVLGIRPQESPLAVGPDWRQVDSWLPVAEMLKSNPGSTAFILNRRLYGVGHAWAAYSLAAEGSESPPRVLWVDMTAPQHRSLTDDVPQMPPVEARVLFVDLSGKVLSQDAGTSSSSTVRALIDPASNHQYGAGSSNRDNDHDSLFGSPPPPTPDGSRPDPHNLALPTSSGASRADAGANDEGFRLAHEIRAWFGDPKNRGHIPSFMSSIARKRLPAEVRAFADWTGHFRRVGYRTIQPEVIEAFRSGGVEIVKRNAPNSSSGEAYFYKEKYPTRKIDEATAHRISDAHNVWQANRGTNTSAHASSSRIPGAVRNSSGPFVVLSAPEQPTADPSRAPAGPLQMVSVDIHLTSSGSMAVQEHVNLDSSPVGGTPQHDFRRSVSAVPGSAGGSRERSVGDPMREQSADHLGEMLRDIFEFDANDLSALQSAASAPHEGLLLMVDLALMEFGHDQLSMEEAETIRTHPAISQITHDWDLARNMAENVAIARNVSVPEPGSVAGPSHTSGPSRQPDQTQHEELLQMVNVALEIEGQAPLNVQEEGTIANYQNLTQGELDWALALDIANDIAAARRAPVAGPSSGAAGPSDTESTHSHAPDVPPQTSAMANSLYNGVNAIFTARDEEALSPQEQALLLRHPGIHLSASPNWETLTDAADYISEVRSGTAQGNFDTQVHRTEFTKGLEAKNQNVLQDALLNYITRLERNPSYLTKLLKALETHDNKTQPDTATEPSPHPLPNREGDTSQTHGVTEEHSATAEGVYSTLMGTPASEPLSS
nr:hypothetical protein StreXyl84_65600 [Streptomyces sp. Xyl84]